jgi:hypothetical protein
VRPIQRAPHVLDQLEQAHLLWRLRRRLRERRQGRHAVPHRLHDPAPGHRRRLSIVLLDQIQHHVQPRRHPADVTKAPASTYNALSTTSMLGKSRPSLADKRRWVVARRPSSRAACPLRPLVGSVRDLIY